MPWSMKRPPVSFERESRRKVAGTRKYQGFVETAPIETSPVARESFEMEVRVQGAAPNVRLPDEIRR